MRKLFSIHKRTIGLGLMGAFVVALAVLGGLLWTNQSASAVPDGVTIKHVNPEGTDYIGNPYCPDTIWTAGVPAPVVTHDCNNIVSQNHVIRTDGYGAIADEDGDWTATAGAAPEVLCNQINDDPADDLIVDDGTCIDEDPVDTIDNDGDTVVDEDPPNVDPLDPDGGWDISNASGATATIVAEGICGTLTEVQSRPGWNPLNDDERCVVIHSMTPGETRVTFTYQDPPGGATTTTAAVIKEWDSLDDSVIMKAVPADVDDDGDIDADDHHLADEQGTTENDNVVFDEATKRIRSADGPIRLVESVHGEHYALINNVSQLLHQPTEGAVMRVTITSNRGCTYFTNAAGTADFGRTMTGVSTWEGRFVGPRVITPPTMPNDISLSPNSHAGPYPATAPLPSAQGDYDLLDIWVDTVCEEQATITIHIGYPDSPGSLKQPVDEWISINWVTIELGKQPVIRWAGEEIVLEKRWALPDMWFPNLTVGAIAESGTECTNAIDDDDDGLINDGCPASGASEEGTECDNNIDDEEDTPADGLVNDGCPVNPAGQPLPVCPLASLYNVDGDGSSGGTDAGDIDALHLVDSDGNGSLDVILNYYVKYLRFDPSPGGLVGGYTDPDHDGYLNSGYAPDGAPDSAISPVDKQCHSKALYGSQEPGEVDVEAVLIETRNHCDPDADAPNPAWVDYDNDGFLECWDAVVDPPASGRTWTDEHLGNKHAFLVWYLKIYQVKLTNVPGARADHNSGAFAAASGASISDPAAGDVEAETLNVSADALLRVQVKGFIRLTDNSWRGPVCLDIDGDGNGLDDDGDTLFSEDKDDDVDNDGDTVIDEDLEAGVPYPLAQYEDGCPDPGDEIVDHGYWVLPDDITYLAGGDPSNVLPNWDVMSDIDDTPTSLSGSGYYIGLKSTLDSHDNIVRPNVPCVAVDLDGDTDIDSLCGRKTVDPDGELTVADAIMPPLKITAQIADPADAGFLKEANKVDDLAITSLYDSIMIPYEPEIPWWVTNGGYDWDSWYCRLQHISGPEDPDGSCPTLDLGLALGPYEFYDVLNILPAPSDTDTDAADCVASAGGVGGPLCNTDLGNQDDDVSDDTWHARKFQFYTDNRGQGFFFANGDYNLDFGLDSADGCILKGGAPDCDQGDIVGSSTIQVNADYPYFRGKWANVNSNPVEKTWEWGGYKDVTAIRIDANHTAIIAGLKDRDGYCKYDVSTDPTAAIGDVVFSPSEHEVQHEWIRFALNTEVGSIIGYGTYAAVSPNALFAANPANLPAPYPGDPHSVIDPGMPPDQLVKIDDHVHMPLAETRAIDLEDGRVFAAERQAVARAEDIRILDWYDAAILDADGNPIVVREDDECQAYIVVQHPTDEDPDVSIKFYDPEGIIERHWPPDKWAPQLVAGWNDACYTDREQPIADALAPLLVDSDGNTVPDLLAVYRFRAPTYGSDQGWDYYFPNRLDLAPGAGAAWITTLAPYDQLILLMEVNNDTWVQTIEPPPDSIDLVELWNSVCYAGDSEPVADATSSIAPDMEILYTLANDMTWRRYAPDRPDLTNIVTLTGVPDGFTSVFALITNPDGATWIFNP